MVDLDVTDLPKFVIDVVKSNVKMVLEHQNSGEETKLDSDSVSSRERFKGDRSLIKFQFRSSLKTKMMSCIINAPF